MITHCSLFRFKPETAAATVNAIIEGFETLGEKIGCIRRITVRRNIGDLAMVRRIAAERALRIMPPGYDLAVLIGFDSLDDYHRYVADPHHWRLIGEWLAPHTTERASIQIADDLP